MTSTSESPRRGRTVCAVVSEPRAKMMARRSGWTMAETGLYRGMVGTLVRKVIENNDEIRAELDTFAKFNLTAWVE